jgi:poly(A) polymerase
VSKLEMLDNIQLAHPFNKGFEYEIECNNEDEVMRVIRGENIDQSEANGTPSNGAAVDSNGESSKVKAYTTSFYVGLVLDTSEIPSNNTRGKYLWSLGKSKQFDISWACHEFYDICKTWNLYNDDMHSIHVVNTRKWVSCFYIVIKL